MRVTAISRRDCAIISRSQHVRSRQATSANATRHTSARSIRNRPSCGSRRSNGRHNQTSGKRAARVDSADRLRGAWNTLPDHRRLRAPCRGRPWRASSGHARCAGVRVSKALWRLFFVNSAAGLSCFAGWRFLQSVFDVDRHGSSLYGLTRRCVLAGSGLFYIVLAVATAHITVAQRRMGEDQAAREWTSWLMKQPLGHGLIALIATGFVGVAIGLAVNAIRSPYIAIGSIRSRRHLALVLALGSFGTLTRAFIFLLLGGFLGVAAYDSNSEEAASLAGVLRAIQSQPYGGVLLGIAALGFIAFGCFEVIEAATRTRAAKLLRGARSKTNVSRR